MAAGLEIVHVIFDVVQYAEALSMGWRKEGHGQQRSVCLVCAADHCCLCLPGDMLSRIPYFTSYNGCSFFKAATPGTRMGLC